MNNFIDNYILHDSVINNICINNASLILEFINGPYIKDNKTNELKKLHNCKMEIIIEALERDKEYEHIDIQVAYKRKIKIINFDKFSKLVTKRKFKTYLNFYSNFTNSMLIKGTLFPFEVELMISEIQNIFIKEL